MSNSEAIAAVRKLFEAVAHRDPAEVFCAYHPDSVISEVRPCRTAGNIARREGAFRHTEGFRSTWNRYQRETSRTLEPEFCSPWCGSELKGRRGTAFCLWLAGRRKEHGIAHAPLVTAALSQFLENPGRDD